MNKEKYLDRIKYSGRLVPSLDLLKKLQKNHLLNVPFENLDIHYQIPIELDIDKIYKKIVLQNRGGFCYELNSLFKELLKSIGFKTFLISGRVYVEDKGTYGQEFDHMAIIVRVENKSYLVDVGYGKFTLEPLEFIINAPQIDDYGTFIIDKFENYGYRVSRLENQHRIPEYIFKLKERQLSEFNAMCDYHQSSPESHFTKKKVISIAKPKGRITLNDKTFKVTKKGKTDTIDFEETEFEKYLNKYFNIQI